MAAMFKYTMLFNYLSGGGVSGALALKGGWSESVYWSTGTAVASFKTLMARRALLLPSLTYISGGRIQQVDPSGSAQTFSVNYPGGGIPTASSADIPQMALLLRARATGVPNVRSMRLAAIPDSQIVFGEFSPVAPYKVAIEGYLARLSTWLMRGTDLSTPKINLESIDATGVYTTQSDLVAPVGQVVLVQGAKDAAGKVYSGKFKVGVATSLRSGKLNGWKGVAVTLGTIRLINPIFPQIIATFEDISRVVPRKIGRPSLGYRGRRSRRRV